MPASPMLRSSADEETDIQLVARVYEQLHRATGFNHPAREAAIPAWRERHPKVSDRDAGDVAHLIVKAINDGLIWGNVKW